MAAAHTPSVGWLNYPAAPLRPPSRPAWWALVLFQLGVFATTSGVLSLREQGAFLAFIRPASPDWLVNAGANLLIFCWIGHTIALILMGAALIQRSENSHSALVSRGAFTCLVCGMLYPLVLSAGVEAWAGLRGGGAEGAAIVCLSVALAWLGGVALARESSDAGASG